MSLDPDTTRIVRSWLDEGVTELPDRVLDAVLAELPATQQRRVPWPARRFQLVSTSLRWGAAAVVVAVVLVGAIVVSGNNGLGTGSSSPSASASEAVAPSRAAAPSATPASPRAVELPATATNLDAGTYRISSAVLTPRSFTLTLPAGWRTDEGWIAKGGTGVQGDLYVTPYLISHVFADVCNRPSAEAEGLVEAGGADQAVSALASQRGHETTGPASVTLGGLPAQRLIFEVAGEFDISTCTGLVMRLWPDAGPDLSGGLLMKADQVVTVYVIDLDGDTLVLATAAIDGTSRSDLDELDRIVASIRFAPEGESVARRWVAAVNDGDADLMRSLMADEITTSDGSVAQADVIGSVLDTWCPMTINWVEPSSSGYLMGVTFGDNEGGTCTAGAPGTTGTFLLEVADGKVTRVP